ncbi:MAG: hypothetical protein ACON4Z_00275 [Planctomycetota bacterium]
MSAGKNIGSVGAARVLVGLQLAAGLAATALALRSCARLEDRVTASVGPWALVVAVLSVGLVLQSTAMFLVWRGRRGSWRQVRLGALTLLGVWAGDLLFLQPLDQLRLEAWIGAAAGAYGLCVLWVVRPGRGAARLAEAVGVQVLATAVLLELAFAGLARLSPSPLWMVDTPDVRRRLAALARPAGEPHMGFMTNSTGHYDVEFVPRAARARRTIAMIGDSFSASYVPHRYHFTTVAEAALGDTEVYNFGIPGIGPPEYLHLLQQQALPLEPDAVVISVFCGNDLAIRPPGAASRVWSWFDRDQVRLLTVPSRLAALLGADASSPATPAGGAAAGLLETEAELLAAYPWLFDHALETGTFSEDAYLSLVRDRLRFACVAEHPRTEALLGYLDEMRSAVGSVPFGVVLLPAEFQVEERLWDDVVSGLERARFDRDEPQASLRAALHARGVPCLDLLPALRRVPAQPDGARHCYLLRDTHLNVRGNAVVGRAIAAWVAQHLQGKS